MTLLENLQQGLNLFCLIFCLIAAGYDLECSEIPNSITFPGIILGAVGTLLGSPRPLLETLVFLLLFLTGPYLFGEGDTKLCMMAVMLLELRTFLFSFILSQILVVISGLTINRGIVKDVVKRMRGRNCREKHMKYPGKAIGIPFAPACFISLCIALTGEILWF